MNFHKNSKGEGRVISDPKNFVADFSVPSGYFSLLNFWEKRGGVTFIQKILLQIFEPLEKNAS